MQPIILDTDLAMGALGSDIDDGFALALAHADPDLSLQLITTVNGNTDVESATLLALELTRQLGVDVPVVRGAAAPLTRPEAARTAPAAITERYGRGLSPAPGFAAVRIAELARAHPGEITLVPIGPLTNVAAAISLEPELPRLLREIVIMGGVFLGGTGRRSMPGEFNAWSDPEAAACVLRSGARQRWVGLDVTLQVRLTRADAERMAAGGTEFGRLAGPATTAWIDHLRDGDATPPSPTDSCAMHDPLAVAAVSRPELITWTDAYVQIITDGPGRGMMITDLLQDPSVEPNVRIGTGVDSDAFVDYFLAAVGRAVR